VRTRIALPAITATAALFVIPTITAAAPQTDPGPELNTLQVIQTTHGLAAQATLQGDTDHVVFTVQQLIAGTPSGPTVNFTVTQPSADGRVEAFSLCETE
jgi:hypothetical protein